MPDVRLDAGDAAELAELLQFLAGWLARDPGRRGASLEQFVGNPAYNVSQLGVRTWTGSPSCSAPTTASPCSARARQGEAMTMASPAARAQEHRRRRLRRRSSSGAPRRVRGRPSGPKGAPHRAARDSPAGCPWPRRPLRPLGPGRAGRPRPAPAQRAARNPAAAGRPGPLEQGNRRSIGTRNRKITNLGRCQGSSEAAPSRIK